MRHNKSVETPQSLAPVSSSQSERPIVEHLDLPARTADLITRTSDTRRLLNFLKFLLRVLTSF